MPSSAGGFCGVDGAVGVVRTVSGMFVNGVPERASEVGGVCSLSVEAVPKFRAIIATKTLAIPATALIIVQRPSLLLPELTSPLPSTGARRR